MLTGDLRPHTPPPVEAGSGGPSGRAAVFVFKLTHAA